MEKEIKINARGLSNPGPRLMVKSAIDGQDFDIVRVVVTSEDAFADLEEYFETIGAIVDVDEIGGEFHLVAVLRG